MTNVYERSTGEYQLVSYVFLRLFALVYFAAFVSFAVQAKGLVGAQGILPLDALVEHLIQLGVARWWHVPMVFHLFSSDAALLGVCGAGIVASLALFFNVLTRTCLIVLFAAYLSLYYAGQTFMSFQWDILLLEAGFLAIFLPLWPRPVAWLFRWLLFRFMFMSGAVKLLYGDPTWLDLTALNFHFETQPLPTALGWYAHHLPEIALKAGVAMTFVIELVVPFMYFLPRRPRVVAALLTLLLELLIMLSGNYNFFNLLTMLLCLFLLDDQLLARFIPAQWRDGSKRTHASPNIVTRWTVSALTAVLVVNGITLTWMEFTRRQPVAAAATLVRLTAPWHIVNSYGLFRVMTTTRPEIIVQGSMDGQTWQDYEFRYKPGNLTRRPRVNIPHQPRLDWQMWFAALGSVERNRWLVNFSVRLLQNEPAVVALVAHNPFADGAPRYVRAITYDYRYAEPHLRARTGQWWVRSDMREYMQPISLRR